MSHIITNITIGNWYLVRGKAVKISPSNVVWAFRDGCHPVPLTTVSVVRGEPATGMGRNIPWW